MTLPIQQLIRLRVPEFIHLSFSVLSLACVTQTTTTSSSLVIVYIVYRPEADFVITFITPYGTHVPIRKTHEKQRHLNIVTH